VSDISTHSGYSLCPFRRAPWSFRITVAFRFLIFISPWPKLRSQNDLNSGGSSW
jgi:hypothetical protein